MSTANIASNIESVRHQVFESHLSLVTNRVARFAARWPWVDRNDLQSAAMNALWSATEPVEVTRHANEIGVYLRRSIDHAMKIAIYESGGLTRFTFNKAKRIIEVWDALSLELHREPTHKEVAERAGVSLKDLRNSLNRLASNRPLSIDIIGDVPDPSASPSDGIQNEERFTYLRRAVSRLPERMRQVVEISYFEERSLADASRKLGISRARVTVLHQEALQRLRRLSASAAPA